jgi:hypothetical protein
MRTFAGFQFVLTCKVRSTLKGLFLNLRQGCYNLYPKEAPPQ